jgi:hypothetical protein
MKGDIFCNLTIPQELSSPLGKGSVDIHPDLISNSAGELRRTAGVV